MKQMFLLSSSSYLHPKACLVLFFFLTISFGPVKDVLPLPRSLALFLSVDHHSCNDTTGRAFSFSVFCLCIKLHLLSVSCHFFFFKYMCSCLLKASMFLKPQKLAEKLRQFVIPETAALPFFFSFFLAS